MKIWALVGAGGLFVGDVVIGLLIGVQVGHATGATWWPIVGLLAGIAAGGATLVFQLRRVFH